MTRLIGLLILTVLIGAPPVPAQEILPDAAAQRITIRELQRLMAEHKVLVVDVRDQTSFEAGHIPGAISIPAISLERHLPELRTETRSIVTYCA